ncbi:hypothetical protein B0A48_00725 [Cryoendolithus antarcticus]|uniref:YDG domain-containing protein n=1 Tax=Cryoendolithus antarcticus TaxID=1507870 RepID=A0A1V8TVX4_9PEZI|nr:hypothetical protein B0A48_00725 [Cryoendolithus antarcticus]
MAAPQHDALDIDPTFVANTTKARIDEIVRQRKNVIQALALQSKKAQAPIIPETDVKDASFLRWLDQEVSMTEAVRKASQVHAAMKLIYGDTYFFEPRFKTYAQQLNDNWVAENWGKGEVSDESETESPPLSPSTSRSSRSNASGDEPTVPRRVPSPTNRHFRPGGIMYGAKRTGGVRKGWMLDDRYQKKSAKVYGHNDIKVGQWYPSQLLAIFNGAHGQKQAGIAGHVDTAAWSVVVSGKYSALDRDEGDMILYPGSNSADVTDPKKPMPSSTGTQALKASHRVGHPVRVLRAAGKPTWGPLAGLRYDGLYSVTGMETPINEKGGMYERFRLERPPGQVSLQSLQDQSSSTGRPTAKELRDYDTINDKY